MDLGRQVVVVLVQPQHPGNVGAVARAMKNMGLARLVLVDAPAFDPERARWMAPGCDDLIAAMRIVGTVDDALVGVTRAIATTARHRKHAQPILEPRQLAEQLAEAPEEDVIAILFGREDHGLDAASVARCEALLRIPTPEHASLNLGQAVLLVCHSLFEAARAHGLRAGGRVVGGQRQRSTRSLARPDPRADVVEMEPAVAEIVALLAEASYAAAPDKIAVTIRGALQRAAPSRRELNALRGMIRQLREHAPKD